MNTPDRRRHDDTAAREAALDVSRSFIVEAPAGSGKTELLIQRYLRLLATVEHPEQVLAITFTRKAAAEMQMRVLQALRGTAGNGVPEQGHERITYEAARSVLAIDARADWRLLENPGRMRIQTLDALNAAIARTQPVSSAKGATAGSLAPEHEVRKLYREAARLTLDQLLEESGMQTAAALVLAHVDSNVDVYISYLARMLATRDQWLPFVGSGRLEAEIAGTLRARLEGNLRAAIEHQLQQLQKILASNLDPAIWLLGDYAAHNQLATGRQSPICALRKLTALPEAKPEALSAWRGLAELLLTRQGQWRKTVNKGQGFPAGEPERDAMIELLAGLQSREACAASLHAVRLLPPGGYKDEQWDVLLALFRLLPLAVTELKRLFATRATSDYVEIALCAAEALGSADEPGDAALLFDYELRHVLIDEMQDTSSAQYRMLESLTGGWSPGDGRTLFCVGDPMQSIYRFRNAEVGQFLLAREHGIAHIQLETLTLRRNFRSGAELVAWFNRVFPQVMPSLDDPSTSAVSYSQARAIPELAGQGTVLVHPLFGKHEAEEAEAGCRLLRQLLEAHDQETIAILVRSRTHLPELLSRLRNAGVSYQALEIDRLTDLPEVIDLIALTRALAHRGDREAWLSLLRSPWLGLEWKDICALLMDGRGATVMELLHDEQRLQTMSQRARDSLSTFRETLATHLEQDRNGSLRDRVERLWLALGGPVIAGSSQGVENAYRFLDVIDRLEVGGTLEDVAGLEDALDSERVSSSELSRVQVMTVHRAKGLEFDHVVLYGLGRRVSGGEREVLSWIDVPGAHGADEKVISPIGPSADLERDAMHRFIGEVEQAKHRNETGRLLYVACTRARRSLHLVGHVPVSANRMSVRPPRRDSLLSLLWPIVEADYEAAFQAGLEASADEHPDRWQTPHLRRFDRRWQMPKAELPAAALVGDKVADLPAVDYHWVGREARVAGTIVHRWLQWAASDVGKGRLPDDQTLRANTSRWIVDAGIRGQGAKTVMHRVAAAIASIRADRLGDWILSGEGFCELALTFVQEHRLKNIVIDRIRIDSDGTHWLIDYKTSTHEGGALDEFLQAETERYREQLQIYADAYASFSGVRARCALYYPLLQKFVEVAV